MWIMMVGNKGQVWKEGLKMDDIKLKEMRNWEQLSGPGNSEGETEHRERGQTESQRKRVRQREWGETSGRVQPLRNFSLLLCNGP